MKYLLDTNICIYLLKDTYPAIKKKLFSLPPSSVFLSAVTVYELEYRAEKSQKSEKTRLQLAMFFAPFTILPFDTEDAVTAGKIRSDLEKKGTPIGPYDLQIAAQGVSRNLTVVTHNTDEFSGVENLRIEDWTKE